MSSLAAEIDNFQFRYNPLKDEKNTINAWANQEFQNALRTANRSSKPCNEKALFKSLKRSFKNHYTDRFTRKLYKGKGLVSRKIPFKHSIYRDFDGGDSIVIGIMAKVYDSASPVVNYNGHQIGTDKFEHFFGRGRAYYDMIHKEGKSVLDALNFGLSSEENFLGAVMTGIMSYADLAANFKGLFFWNHILMKYPDPLEFEKPSGPYVICSRGRWVQNTSIDFSIYIDDSWDEAVNCSKFRTKELAEKVFKVQLSYEQLDPAHKYTCPVMAEEAVSLHAKFGQYAPLLFNLGPVYLE
ncbi:MAG TPA: hypothetical protein DCY86_00605 [Bdellovibrionales bacterium]|nr:hypothetical protein [Bdellovibrionales bacterium]